MDITSTKPTITASKEKMQRALDFLQEAMLAIRAGKASTNILNGIDVEYYGNPTPISNVASITVPDARTVLVQPWEKAMIAPIEKAIMVSNIGLTPSNNGEHIRLTIPPLTEERRKELVKQVRSEGESTRITIRSIRRDTVDAFKKAIKEGMPEDMSKDGENEAQKLTDSFSKKIDEILAEKEKEIMTV